MLRAQLVSSSVPSLFFHLLTLYFTKLKSARHLTTADVSAAVYRLLLFLSLIGFNQRMFGSNDDLPTSSNLQSPCLVPASCLTVHSQCCFIHSFCCCCCFLTVPLLIAFSYSSRNQVLSHPNHNHVPERRTFCFISLVPCFGDGKALGKSVFFLYLQRFTVVLFSKLGSTNGISLNCFLYTPPPLH